MEIEGLIRENIRKLVPYASARDEFSGTASIFLDANENPHNSPLNRYPDPGQRKVKVQVSRLWGEPEERIFLGNGSDEGIDLLIRIFCEPGRHHIITVDPTYGMYGVCAAINDVETRSVSLRNDFSLDPEAVIRKVDRNTRIIFLCSPNNPTSNAHERDAILRIVDHVPCVVAVDEAYIDFSRQPGLLSDLEGRENLVVIQTFSKAWGLAGIRLGMVFGNETVIEFMTRVKYPYNLNTLSIEKGLEALRHPERRENWVKQILEERKALSDRLGAFPMVSGVYPSDANFLLVKVVDPRALYTYLMEQGIIVRDRSSVPLCENCLRITVGTRDENKLLMQALERFTQSGKN